MVVVTVLATVLNIARTLSWILPDLILDYSLAQCNETGSSVAMEKEGLRRRLEKLMAQHVNIFTIARDRHTDVASLIKTEYPHIQHQYDVWNLAKSVIKNLG